ncbi:hypothetical protein [Siansivirga zeaxanthinifaciens]|uniref:Uncharacterized protein n=1 Tax=Siansivirga zeaxanthinifaciens CC-SAMT-1 TaxID=1454006 RepID=A0A0C5WHX4_9FLAO|nr:hypothetical protein [Siansivirga zeaxanthinifaciens]AJR04749.1 hypothetical protein AW14_03085 [Siansivirga zeaxanthinifaciens CC-SAMT-1]
MKYLKSILALLVITSLFNCSPDEAPPQPLGNNAFNIAGTQYDTNHGYLLLDDGPSFNDGFGLTFVNGVMIEDNTNGISLQSSTTQGVVLWVNFSNAQVNSEQAVTYQITNNTTFVLDEETTAITDIINYDDVYSYNGIQYGDPDDATAIIYEVGATGNGTLDIISFTVDLTTRTGTINCNYTFVDNNNTTITGAFNGSFDIINEF